MTKLKSIGAVILGALGAFMVLVAMAVLLWRPPLALWTRKTSGWKWFGRVFEALSETPPSSLSFEWAHTFVTASSIIGCTLGFFLVLGAGLHLFAADPPAHTSESEVIDQDKLHALEVEMLAQEHRLVAAFVNVFRHFGRGDGAKERAALSAFGWALWRRSTQTVVAASVTGASIIALLSLVLQTASIVALLEQTGAVFEQNATLNSQNDKLQAQLELAKRLEVRERKRMAIEGIFSQRLCVGSPSEAYRRACKAKNLGSPREESACLARYDGLRCELHSGPRIRVELNTLLGVYAEEGSYLPAKQSEHSHVGTSCRERIGTSKDNQSDPAITAFFRDLLIRDADLRMVCLSQLTITNATLSGVDLSDAILGKSSFINSDLAGAILYKALLEDTKFGDSDLRGVVFFAKDQTSDPVDPKQKGMQFTYARVDGAQFDQRLFKTSGYISGTMCFDPSYPPGTVDSTGRFEPFDAAKFQRQKIWKPAAPGPEDPAPPVGVVCYTLGA